MPAVARGSGTDSVLTGHTCTVTTKTDKCSTNVFINSKGACRKGDAIKVHTYKKGKNCVNHTEKIKAGSASVFVNGIPISRKGDSADAGVISSGSPNVIAGDFSMAGPALSGATANSSTSNSTTTETPKTPNQAPGVTGVDVDVKKNSTKTFTKSDFNFVDTDANNLSAIVITSIPKEGFLTLGKTRVKENQSIPANLLSTLTYHPNTKISGEYPTFFKFKAKDDGGTANGGKNTSVEGAIIINVSLNKKRAN